MSGTMAGGLKAARTNKLKYGKSFYKVIGRTGGSKKVKKGFAVSGLASIAGRKGGLTSRKGKKPNSPIGNALIGHLAKGKWWDIKR